MPGSGPPDRLARWRRARRVLALAVAVVGLGGCASSDVSREVGARCDEKAECDERCLAPSPSYPGGFCSLSCASDRDCTDDSRCVADDGGVCLLPCGDDDDCASLGDGWRCRTREAAGGGEVGVCRG